MSNKVFESGKGLQEKLCKGVDTLADNVASTLGPRGRNVILYDKNKKLVKILKKKYKQKIKVIFHFAEFARIHQSFEKTKRTFCIMINNLQKRKLVDGKNTNRTERLREEAKGWRRAKERFSELLLLQM